MEQLTFPDLYERLKQAGVVPTLQRLAIASVLLPRAVHMTADQVLSAARGMAPGLSRATVYGTLELFVRSGLLRELATEGAATVFDSNLSPHHHVVHVDGGLVEDLPTDALRVEGLEGLAEHYDICAVDLVVRVRQRASRQAAP